MSIAIGHFRSVKELAFWVLDDCGGCSSIPELVARVNNIIKESGLKNYQVDANRMYTYRKLWRDERETPEHQDCRTHKTQPRRNHLDDNKFSHEGWTATFKLLNMTKIDPLLEWADHFHSTEQMKNLLKTIKALNMPPTLFFQQSGKPIT